MKEAFDERDVLISELQQAVIELANTLEGQPAPVLADSGTRYQSKLFNPEFLRSKKLPVPPWIEKKTNVEIPFEKV